MLVGAFPDDPAYVSELAYCHLKMGEPEEAIKYYKKLKRLGEPAPAYYGGLYCAYLELNEPEKAIKIAREGVKKLPGYSGLHENLAEFYLERGFIERKSALMKKASEAIAEALGLFPEDEVLNDLSREIETESALLDEDLRKNTWRNAFKEDDLTKTKAPVFTFIPFSMYQGVRGCLKDEVDRALCLRNWYDVAKEHPFDTVHYTAIYRGTIGMDLDDYLSTKRRGTKLIFFEAEGEDKIRVRKETIELCKRRGLTALRCKVIRRQNLKSIAGLVWENLLEQP